MLCGGCHTEALLKADKQIISLTPVGEIKVMDILTVPLLLFSFIPPCFFSLPPAVDPPLPSRYKSPLVYSV